MRHVPFRDSKWFFGSDDTFQGLRTGSVFCTQHECGIRLIAEAFDVDGDAESIKRYLVRKTPDFLFLVERKGVLAIICDPRLTNASEAQVSVERHLHRLHNDEPLIAWDNQRFLLLSPLANARHAMALKSLWDAFQRHDVYLGGPLNDKYQGGGMGFFIGNKMPKAEMDATSQEIAEKAEKARQIEKGVKRDKFEKIKDKLSKQGKEWFALSPHGLFEDGSVMYWLNPRHQQRDYFGAVTIQDLKDWTQDTGKIPGGARR